MNAGQFELLPAEIAESRRHAGDVVERLCEEIRQSAEETRREFHVVEEGWRSAVEQLAGSLTRLGDTIDRVRTELKAEFAETRALFRLTCSDLNPRVTRPEGELHSG